MEISCINDGFAQMILCNDVCSLSLFSACFGFLRKVVMEWEGVKCEGRG